VLQRCYKNFLRIFAVARSSFALPCALGN
jgi:hypothetical protein